MKHYFLLRSVKRNFYIGILRKNFNRLFSRINPGFRIQILGKLVMTEEIDYCFFGLVDNWLNLQGC